MSTDSQREVIELRGKEIDWKAAAAMEDIIQPIGGDTMHLLRYANPTIVGSDDFASAKSSPADKRPTNENKERAGDRGKH